jgi:hypothetical protein
MNTQHYKEPLLENCPLEDDEDALWLKIKESKKSNINVCPFEEFEDLNEAHLLNKN